MRLQLLTKTYGTYSQIVFFFFTQTKTSKIFTIQFVTTLPPTPICSPFFSLPHCSGGLGIRSSREVRIPGFSFFLGLPFRVWAVGEKKCLSYELLFHYYTLSFKIFLYSYFRFFSVIYLGIMSPLYFQFTTYSHQKLYIVTPLIYVTDANTGLLLAILGPVCVSA